MCYFCVLCRLHGSRLGDEGIKILVDGLIDKHNSSQIPPEQMEAIQKRAQDVVADVMQEALLTTADDPSDPDNSSAVIAAMAAQKRKDSYQQQGLTQLDLGDCEISNDSALDVARLISQNTPISTLNLTGNKTISAIGWADIADALKVNHYIHTLSLDYNDLGDMGATILSDALRENTTLRFLDLEGNRIREAGGYALLAALRENQTLRDITLMPGNDMPEQLLGQIKQILAEGL